MVTTRSGGSNGTESIRSRKGSKNGTTNLPVSRAATTTTTRTVVGAEVEIDEDSRIDTDATIDRTSAEGSNGTSTANQNVDVISARTKINRRNRSSKEQLKQILRMKSTGMGVTIQNEQQLGKDTSTSLNRKIIFDDDVDHTNYVDDHPDEQNYNHLEKVTDAVNDDDNVEEVIGSIAKHQIRMEAEHIRIATSAAIVPKKKRRASKICKVVQQNGSDDNTNFDEDFFHQLECEHVQNKKLKKSYRNEENEGKGAQKPQHTTFVVTSSSRNEIEILDNDMDSKLVTKNVMDHPHNIQVVVLDNDETFEMTNEPLSDMIRLYSRCGYIESGTNFSVGGAAETTTEQPHVSKKKFPKKATIDATWTRTNKMKQILSVPSRIRRKGKAAMHFAIKSIR
jgi:hypothetical protein